MTLFIQNNSQNYKLSYDNPNFNNDFKFFYSFRFYMKRLNRLYTAAPISADTGMVSTHAVIISRETPHRTADRRLIAPTPMIEPLMTCVVETGILNICEMLMVSAPAVCAQKPSIGVILVILLPIVLIIRQPPDIVPIAMAVKHANAAHSGTGTPKATNSSVG